MKKKILTNKKGITLIALVVTIIVLLILAGVSVSMLTGENGIIAQAQKAKAQNEIAEREEEKRLLALEAASNYNGKTYTEKDASGNVIASVYIPVGFAMTGREGESTVAEGLVIIDSKGNEFVWIPCIEAQYNATNTSWRNDGYTDKTWTDTANYDAGLASVQKYGGFYVARYEAGIPEEMTEVYLTGAEDTLTYTKDDKKNVTTYIPVSKKGVQSWNYISQLKAKEVSEKMVKQSDVQSYLIDSNSWDRVCNVIDEKTNKDIINSSKWGNYHNNTTTKYGNIKNLYAVHHVINGSWQYAQNYKYGKVKEEPSGKNRIELATGSSENFKAYNIYDMAGNMWEWTTEVGKMIDGSNPTTTYAVYRGGSFGVVGDSSGYTVVCRNGYNTMYACGNSIGFRVALYLK